LRFEVQNTGNTAANQTWAIFMSKNAGAYAAVTQASANGVKSSAAASSSADETAIATRLLTAATGTYSAGIYDNTGVTATKSLAAAGVTEFEFGLILDYTVLNNADTLDFRVYSGGAVLNTYTVTPRITVVKRTANVAITQANDTMAAAATHPVTANSSLTEGPDTLLATGAVTVGGSASLVEGPDTLVADGTSGSVINANLSVTEANDTLVADGSITLGPINVSASIVEANDTLSAASGVSVKGTSSITEANDTLSAATKVTVGGSANITEANDTMVAAAKATVGGSASIVEANDTLTALVSILNRGNAIIVEANDTLVASGGIAAPPTYANASIIQANDILYAQGKAEFISIASLIVTQEDYVLVAEASVGVPPYKPPDPPQEHIVGQELQGLSWNQMAFMRRYG
jgi:hypothetical protein